MTDTFTAPVEFKFAAESAPKGEFSGYASVFNVLDAHGDIVLPGAFRDSLNERKAAGRTIPMYLQHGMGGDGLPVGVWRKVDEDDRGLHVEGKISGVNTDAGRLTYERLADGAYGGLSMGYRAVDFDAGKSAGQPRRVLRKVNLVEISLVDDPSNPFTRVDEVKAAADNKAMLAADTIVEAMKMFRAQSAERGLEDSDDYQVVMSHLSDAYEMLTGVRTPAGVKAAPSTIREFETLLRASGFSHSRSRAIAEFGFKSTPAPRDEAGGQAVIDPEFKSAIERLSAFKLT
jgi:HK97 family phage prohead protease